MAAAAPDAPAGGGNPLQQFPYESIVARAVFDRNRRSVVRLQIRFPSKDNGKKDRFGCGTGFIVLNTASHMVIMTCGHSFETWIKGSAVRVTFHDFVRAEAQVKFLQRERELALLVVDASARPELSDAARYPPVAFSQADAHKGTFLVMLGYPTSTQGDAEMGTFHGSVTNEVTTIFAGREDNVGLQLLSADNPSGPGASGAPVFGVFGDDHMVVGLCKGGLKEVSYTVPVSCIHDTLKAFVGVPRGGPENATTREILRHFLTRVLARQQAVGDPGAGPSSSAQATRGAGGVGQPRRTRGSGAAGPSSTPQG